MISPSSSFLIVDDDDVFRNRLTRAVQSRGFHVENAGSSEEAIRLTKAKKPSHIILDLRMPHMSGLEILREIKQIHSECNVLILTGYGSIATALEAVREGAVNYLSKPTDLEHILNAFSIKQTQPQKLISVPSLPRVEWEHIQRIMQECGGNISKAAKLLGLHRRSLQRKLKNPPE